MRLEMHQMPDQAVLSAGYTPSTQHADTLKTVHPASHLQPVKGLYVLLDSALGKQRVGMLQTCPVTALLLPAYAHPTSLLDQSTY